MTQGRSGGPRVPAGPSRPAPAVAGRTPGWRPGMSGYRSANAYARGPRGPGQPRQRHKAGPARPPAG
jgi:hypothetical protein